MKNKYRLLSEIDKKHIWHPFTQMKDWVKEDITIIESADGVYLKDIYGKKYIDGVSSLWTNLFGHRNKLIDKAITSQLKKVAHSTFLGLTHEPAILLTKELMKIVPKNLTKVFYSDNGSTAVEIALKMAFQYHQLKGDYNRTCFLAVENSYHGDTIGSVSVGGIELFHKRFKPLLFKTYFTTSPYCYRCKKGRNYPECEIACIKDLEEILDKHHKEIAAAIIEPMVQAAGGIIVMPKKYLEKFFKTCKRYNLLVIFDEVATGFGRTGKMFACEHIGVSPDFLCLAKSITGGYLPLAATLTTDEVYSAFLGEYSEFKTFFHGHTYTANPLACSAALAVLKIFKQQKILGELKKKIKLMSKILNEIKELNYVGDVRQCGFIAGIELVKDKETKKPFPVEEKIAWKICYILRKKGIWFRPLGDVIVVFPPLTITLKELDYLLKSVKKAIEEISKERR